MSLSSSMWSSVSGLLSHGEAMGVVSNNIANINTVGFKGSRMDFSTLLSQNVGTTSGTSQVGCGVGLGIVMNNFTQGTLETTTMVTDVAINGNGFYRVSPQGSSQSYYTRAGNFSLTQEGYMVDANGYVLQGWAVNGTSYGSPVDIKLDTSTCSPLHTTLMSMQINLPATANDKTEDPVHPFFSLLNAWDATQTPPLGTAAYAFSTTIQVYDEGGTLHTLTVYFDQVNNDSLTNGKTDEKVWEYIITMDPTEDNRDFNGMAVPDNLKGLLGSGTMVFNSTGQMTDMTCFVPQYDLNYNFYDPSTLNTSGGVTTADLDLSGWVSAPTDTNGYPLICANFSGAAGMSNAYDSTDYSRPNPEADGRLIAIDFGLSSLSGNWDFPPTLLDGNGLLVAGIIGGDRDRVSGYGNSMVRSNTATTCQGDSYQEYNLNANGYTFGWLSTINIATDGTIYGVYSNGENIPLYQITLYNFSSLQNLRSEGNNLYSETAASGNALAGVAGTGPFGTTEAYRLEQSNVDLSTEMVKMITTQRGFQSNSKTITTVDTMLETVISMKR